MKIVHISLVAFSDYWGYQENILPQYQYDNGDDVTIIACDVKYEKLLDSESKRRIKGLGYLYFIDGVKIIRIPISKKVGTSFVVTKKLYEVLKNEAPDVIIQHNIVFPVLFILAKYKSNFPKVRLLADNHADCINRTPSKLWYNFKYKFLDRLMCKLVQKYFDHFLGVTPLRCDFLKDVYGVRESRISLYPIGADTKLADSLREKENLRIQYRFSEKDFIIISGGKMGKEKGTDLLIEAFSRLVEKQENVKLILFGLFSDDLIKNMAYSQENVIIYDWCDRVKTLELLKLSDLAVWPIHHTTLIEDAIACNTPLILRKTRNTLHLNEGNGLFLIGNITSEKILKAIENIIQNYASFFSQAKDFKEKISYAKISQMFCRK